MDAELFEAVPDALLVVDGRGRIVRANANAARLFGYEVEAMAGLPIEMLMPEATRGRHREHRQRYMDAPRVRAMGDAAMSLVGQHRSGEQFPVEIALSPLGSGAEGADRFLASIRDVSESQRVRQTLLRARYDAVLARIGQQALARDGMDDVLGAVPELLAETLDVDAVAIALLRMQGGADVRAAVGLDAQLSAWCDSQYFWRRLVAGRLLTIPVPVAPGVGADDVHDGGSVAAVPLLDRDRVAGVLLARTRRRFEHDALHLLQSVGNLLAALVQRQRTEEQLAHVQRLDALGQLTGGVAHDFNNLLTVMSGNLQLLEDECCNLPVARELIAASRRSVDRGADLTRKLLAFARRQHLDPTIVDVARLLQDVSTMLGRTLGESIELAVTCLPHLPAVRVDEAQLESALLNLALNARDAMPEGGALSIAAEEHWIGPGSMDTDVRPGHYLVISVCDTGHGMSAGIRARAIEPFFTTKPGGRGSGLGLSMVYGFVVQSGGLLRIDSRPTGGTRVDVYLPVAPAAPLGAAAPARRSARAGDGETVLIVEDERAVLDVADAFVRSLGYRSLTATSADEALARLGAEEAVTVLFSDVMLGAGPTGVELATRARALRPGLAVLLASGHEVATVPQSEGFELLRKPYLREQLAAALRAALDRVEREFGTSG